MFNKLRYLRHADSWREQIVLKLHEFEAEMLNSQIFLDQSKEGLKVANVVKLLNSTKADALEEVLSGVGDLCRAISIPGITAETIEKLYDKMADDVCENQNFNKTSKLLDQGLLYAERHRIEMRIGVLQKEMARGGNNARSAMEQKNDLQRLYNRLNGLDRLIMMSGASVNRNEAKEMYERNVTELRKLGSKIRVKKITNKMEAEEILRINAILDQEIKKIMRMDAALNQMYAPIPNYENIYGNGMVNNAPVGGQNVDAAVTSEQSEFDVSLDNIAETKAEYKKKESICAREINRETENLKKIGDDLLASLQAYKKAEGDPIEQNRLTLLIKELDRKRKSSENNVKYWTQCKTKISDCLEGLERLETMKRAEVVGEGVSIDNFKEIAAQINEQTKKSNEDLREMEMARNLSYAEEIDTGLSEEPVSETTEAKADEQIQRLLKEYNIQ